MFGSAREIDSNRLQGAVAVVIDVLRATSVMVSAFQNGVESIIAVTSPDEAFRLKKGHPHYLLGGEQNADYIPGFDFDNSPFNYTPAKVKGKTLVMSTSNGTRAINGSLNADRLLIASFLNAQSVIDLLKNEEKIIFVCSGSKDVFTLEDSLCAGYMIDLVCRQIEDVQLSDFAVAIRELYSLNQNNVQSFASKGSHYQILERKGYIKDLDYCFTSNIIDKVPELKCGQIV